MGMLFPRFRSVESLCDCQSMMAILEGSTCVVEGLVKASKNEALVIMTVHSSFMWATQLAGAETLEGFVLRVMSYHIDYQPGVDYSPGWVVCL